MNKIVLEPKTRIEIGEGSWTLFEERGYMSIEQFLSVFWYIVRLTPGFVLK